MKSIFTKIPLLKSFSAYTFFNIINSGIPFILLPLLTNYLSTADYGILSNLNGLFLFIVPFIGINISAAVNRQFVKKDVNLPLYIGNSLFVVVIAFGLVQLLLFLSKGAISNYTQIPEHYI